MSPYQKWGWTVLAAAIPLSIGLAHAALAWLLMVWFIQWRRGEVRWEPNALSLPIGIYLTVVLISGLFGLNPLKSAVGLASHWHIAIFLLLLTMVKDRAELDRIAWIVLASAAVNAVYGVGQHLMDGLDLFRWGENRIINRLDAENVRAAGAFSHPMTFAGQTTMVIAYGSAWWLAMRSGRAGWTRAGLIAILTAGLIFSFIRSAWLGTMAAVFLVGWTYGRGTAVRAVIGLAAIVMAVGLADPAVQKRFLSMTDLKNPETDMSAQSNVERLRTWRVATEVIRDHPYLGVGGGNFRTAFDEHRAAFDVRSRPHAHNNLLQQTAEYGIPGGMAFVAVWCVFFGEAWKGWRRIRDPVAGFRLVGAAAAVAGFLTAGLFESNFGDSEVAMMMWLMVGIAMWETKRWTTAH